MKPITPQLNHAIIEFYDKLSSWEHAVIRDKKSTLSQVHAAEILGINGPMRMKELASKMGITTGTLTVQVDKMVSNGLVERLPHANDRRSILVGLTKQGMALFKEHDALHMQLTSDITASFSEEEAAQLLGLLHKMNAEF